MNKAFLVGLVALGLTVTAARAQITYTWNGGNGSWHTATNWTPAGLPGTNDSVVINSGFVTLSTPSVIASITINGGVLTHPQGNTNGVNLTAHTTVHVAAGAYINVSAAGYLGGTKPGNIFVRPGQTRGLGGVPAPGSDGYSGGSYGSPGGGGFANPLYGSITAPVDLGSGGGGGDRVEYGGNGGGRIHLRAQSLVVDGLLLANGERSWNGNGGATYSVGGGSGGSIFVELSGGTFAGSGVIEAKGGPSLGANVGGGGRIAVVGCFSKSFSGVMTNTGTLYLNRCPVLPVQMDRGMDELIVLVVTNTAYDEDLTNVLTYSFLAAPASATISTNGIIQWLPLESDGPSTNTFITVVWDNAKAPLSATNSFTVIVNEINTAPTLALPGDQVFNELTTFTASAAATDADIPVNALMFELVSGPSGLTVSSAGAIEWTPGEAQGPNSYLVTVRVVDDNPDAVNERHLATTNSFTLTVNEVNVAPLLTVPADQIIIEQTLLNVAVGAADVDLPANALRFALVSPPTGMTIDSASGAISWTPDESQGSNTYTITVTLTDANPPAVNAVEFTVTNSFVVTVLESNRPPVLVLPSDPTIEELAFFSTNATATDPNLPANQLVFALVSGPSNLTVSAGGHIEWTPGELQGPGTHIVTISVTDSNALAVNATSLSVTGSFQIIVAEVNSAPVLTQLEDVRVDELVPFTVQAIATDADLPANALTFSLVNGPAGLTVSPAGAIAWTPDESQGTSTNTVVISVTDTNPLAVNATSLSVTSSFEIVVNEVNAAPALATPADQVIYATASLSLSATATDADLPVNLLTFGLVSGPVGLSVGADGLITWTPGDALADTTNAVTLSVTDNGTPSLGTTNTFMITVVTRPILSIHRDGTNAVISWPVAITGFTLEYTTQLDSGEWFTEPAEVVDTATEHTVTVPADVEYRFYRLKR